MTTPWTRSHLELLDLQDRTTEVFEVDETRRVIDPLYLWDLWPLRLADGSKARVGTSELWMALSAPSELEPGERHDIARIRLLSHAADVWFDQGPAFPEESSAGSREWAGCATYDAGGQIEILYTAVGRRAETSPSFVQRIVSARGRLSDDGSAIDSWSPHQELVTPSGLYASTRDQDTGEPGFIKAFRDPFRFEDPISGEVVVLFTGSMHDSRTDFDGAVGLARGPDTASLSVMPPLVTADGVNNELERPHLVHRDDLLYLFFSTQARTFHPDVTGVTGLYGFVAADLDGPWEPLNGSGLVLANPLQEPHQAYSWLVLRDLSVTSFVDFHSLGGQAPADLEQAGTGREHFGGTPAPVERISLDGATSTLQRRSRA